MGLARCLVSLALHGNLGRVVADLLCAALCPFVGRCAAIVEAGFCGERHLGLRGVSTCGWGERGRPTFLAAGASLWALLSKTSAEGDIGGGGGCEIMRNTEKARASLGLCGQTTAECASPTCFTPARGLRRDGCATGVREEGVESRHAG